MTHEPEYLHATGRTFDEVLDAELDQAECWLMGEGFVMSKPAAPREVWPGIEDDVRELERLIACTP